MATVPASRTPFVVLLVGVLGISWAAIFVRLADEAPALTIAAYRLLIAAAILLLLVAVARARGKLSLPPRSSLPLLALSGVFLAGHFWSWFASLEHTSVASSVVIVGLQPLLGALIAFAVLRERPAPREYAGLAIAIVGLLCITISDLTRGIEFLIGDLLALLAAFFVAVSQTIRRKTRDETGALPYSAVAYTSATVVLWLAVLIVRPSISGFAADAWVFILLLAFIPQLVGHTSINYALGHLRVVTVGLAILGEPLLATIYAIPVLGETPPIGVLIGGPLIVAGVALGLSGSRAPVEPQA
ncbi:MAG: DMT family transporter [Dehalococcoidia bacterium]|nr:DMT family transporter [Dehalococcoidia bacterium]